MKKLFRVPFTMLLARVLLLVPIVAHAGERTSGTISLPHFISNGVVIFYTSGTRTNVPACATLANRFAINGATAAGRIQVAGLLSAYTQGKQVAVIGTGSCPDWGETESVSYFYVVS